MLFFLNYKNSSASTMFRPARACHVHQNRLQQYCHAIYRTSERCVTCILLSCQQPLSGTLQNNGKEVVTSSAYGDSNIEHHMRTAGSSSLDIVVCILGQNPSFTVTWNIYLVERPRVKTSPDQTFQSGNQISATQALWDLKFKFYLH